MTTNMSATNTYQPLSASPAAVLHPAQTWRLRGLTTRWFRLLHALGLYRRCVVTLTDVTARVPVKARIDVECAELALSELDEYLTFRPGADRADLEQRFERGHHCFAARRDGRMVCTSWAGQDTAYLAFLNCELVFAPKTYYVYDTYVSPQCRGREVASAVSAIRLPVFTGAGCTQAVGITWPQNSSASRRTAKGGATIIGVIGSYGVGPWQRRFLRFDSALVDPTNPPLRLARDRPAT